jgi:hypothetical protein
MMLGCAFGEQERGRGEAQVSKLAEQTHAASLFHTASTPAAGYHAPHLAFEWGLVPPHPEPHSLLATASSSNLVALSRLSRLTHLALHVSGAAAADVGAALMPLRRLRELLLSGSSGGPLPLPAVMGGMRELQLLVVQQQVSVRAPQAGD